MKKYIFLISIFIYLLIVPNILKAQAPTITSFSPSSGGAGTLVTIIGTNLEQLTAFSIGGVTAIVVSDTSIIASSKGDTLVGLVMPGEITGAISVTTAGGTVTSASNFTATQTPYPNTQQGNKLVGTGATGTASQGISVSISADGNTAIVGGCTDNSNAGAAWIYTRSSGIWTQQGSKLVGTGAVYSASQGISVSISADGNTAIVGGYSDNGGAGAAWIFTRSGGTWMQQGSKLIGTGAVNGTYGANQGVSVSISADGNTAIVGANEDNGGAGAVWVYTRSGGTWKQQGSKLVGTGAIGLANLGTWVSISADGNNVIVGGDGDNSNTGAAWIFTRSGGTWTQQGSKLVGTGAKGSALQGISVSISADGNTAIVGGSNDSSDVGAAWIYTRSGGIWTQQGNKLVGTGAAGKTQQGFAVSISADGNTAIVGGHNDSNHIGAVWAYMRSGGIWIQQGSKLVGTGTVGLSYQGWSVSISADGNTAIIGGYGDNVNTGAAWIFNSSIPTGIENILKQESFTLYPNPSNGWFKLLSSTIHNNSRIEIYSIAGERLYSCKLMGRSTLIDMSLCTSGLYLYRVLTETGILVSDGKFVIQK
ncbi:MAG TPA: T9SS type A sorting domain-containing protein [Bacteroidia bacterium]|jgi:hypothetical protein|nr:T9SS type A sorting domain-containing protein [Bacteroidia bacterium]